MRLKGLSNKAVRRIAQSVYDQDKYRMTENQRRWVEKGQGYVEVVDIDSLIETEWSGDNIAPIVQNKIDQMAEHFTTPGMGYGLVETYPGEDGELYIADGHHRVVMFKQLGIQQIPVFIAK